eukprot:TRINITY_DN26934_c0_g1_i1.p1 TRINITY_DN26934_c0_g1~~TRINITY_DN26934_c0_g1_i1.p1  ORF type:complete len:215 (+),score=21.60 TRINITY_DN26934_c0_g1_i1:101-745(+)
MSRNHSHNHNDVEKAVVHKKLKSKLLTTARTRWSPRSPRLRSQTPFKSKNVEAEDHIENGILFYSCSTKEMSVVDAFRAFTANLEQQGMIYQKAMFEPLTQPGLDDMLESEHSDDEPYDLFTTPESINRMVGKKRQRIATLKTKRTSAFNRLEGLAYPKNRVTVDTKELLVRIPLNKISRYKRIFKRGSDPQLEQIGRAVQQECRDRSRMPSSA